MFSIKIYKKILQNVTVQTEKIQVSGLNTCLKLQPFSQISSLLIVDVSEYLSQFMHDIKIKKKSMLFQYIRDLERKLRYHVMKKKFYKSNKIGDQIREHTGTL